MMDEPAKKQCLNCYKGLPEEAKFCPYCGAPVPVFAKRKRPRHIRELPTDLTGPCAILRKTDAPLPVGDVGRIIAKALGKPLFDVTRQISATRGFLVKNVEADVARKITPELEKLGVESFAVPMDSLESLPEAGHFDSGSFTEHGIKCEIYFWDGWERLERPWEDVKLISCGRFAVSSSRVVETGRTWFGQEEKLVTEVKYRFIIDIFFEEPERRARIEQGTKPGVASEGPSALSEAQLMNLAKQIIMHSADTPKNQAVRTLAFDGPTGFWGPFTFDTRHDFDDYNVWLMELLKYGMPIP